MVNKIHKQIIKKIKEYDTIVIARHIGPDPDAVASQMALKEIIELNYPGKTVYAVGSSVSKFKFLGTTVKIDESKLQNALLIITDVPRFDRVDAAYQPRYDYTIKIDHHPCEERVCDLEFVDDSASSASELITELVYKTKLKINKSIAEKLYIGIIADSDRFLLSYTTPRTLVLAAKLIDDFRFDLMALYNKLYERGLNERKFEAFIINNMEITKNGFGYIKINNDVIKEYDVDSSTASNMVNNLNFIKELEVWAFSSYDEKLGLYKINIRSRGIMINDVAEKFNGGGHKFASGARLKTEEEVEALFKALDARCKEYKQSKEN